MSTIYTVGHSTRAIEDFIALLRANQVAAIADVRTIPKSRHNPQFGEAALQASLEAAGLGYSRWPALGGLRRARADSENLGWRNASFRGFADYMQSPEFAAALAELETMAKQQRTAVMCAEAVPWRCHRSLIADALTVHGWHVLDIISPQEPQAHRLTPFLVVRDGRLGYPAPLNSD